MKNILFVFLLTSFMSYSQQEYKPVNDIKVLEERLNESSKKIHTIKSDFTQEKHLAYLNETIESEGKFWFKKENQLRWEYQTPFEYIIVLNNGKFIIKDEDKTSEYDVASNKAFREVNDLIISSVKGDLLKEDKFNILAFKNAKSYLIKLTPKDPEMAKVLHKIELYFNISDLDIFKVKMIENEDDFTIINFVNRKLNAEISPDIFNIN